MPIWDDWDSVALCTGRREVPALLVSGVRDALDVFTLGKTAASDRDTESRR